MVLDYLDGPSVITGVLNNEGGRQEVTVKDVTAEAEVGVT